MAGAVITGAAQEEAQVQAATAVGDPHDTLQEWYARRKFRLLSKTAQGQEGIGGGTALGLEKASQGVTPMVQQHHQCYKPASYLLGR